MTTEKEQPRKAEQPLAGSRRYPERATGEGSRYVVLHTGVEGFSRGQVVAAGDFPADTDFERLLRLGAVRDASGAEGQLDSVPVGAEDAGRAADLARLRAECDRQKQQIEALQNQIQKGEATRQKQQAQAPAGPPPEDVQLAELMATQQRQAATLGDLTDKARALGPPAVAASASPAGPAPAGKPGHAAPGH